MSTVIPVVSVAPGGGIDAKFCPPSIPGICDTCLQFKTTCLVTWAGVTRSLTCRECRLA